MYLVLSMVRGRSSWYHVMVGRGRPSMPHGIIAVSPRWTRRSSGSAWNSEDKSEIRNTRYKWQWFQTNYISRSPFLTIFHLQINSLAPGRLGVIDGWGISCETALIWMSLDFTDDQSTLVQVMAWCCQATSHYLSQCWPRTLSSYGATGPQWVNSLRINDAIWHHRSVRLGRDDDLLPADSKPLPDQCWLIIKGVPWYKPYGNFAGNASFWTVTKM